MGLSVTNPPTGISVPAPVPPTSVPARGPGPISIPSPAPGVVSIPTGQSGPPGKSAYELAVENGFVGTERQWLAEVEGDPGPTGPQGPQGPPGISEVVIPDLQDLSTIFENGLF